MYLVKDNQEWQFVKLIILSNSHTHDLPRPIMLFPQWLISQLYLHYFEKLKYCTLGSGIIFRSVFCSVCIGKTFPMLFCIIYGSTSWYNFTPIILVLVNLCPMSFCSSRKIPSKVRSDSD